MTDIELLNAAISLLVRLELDIPCDYLTDVDDVCFETCKYNCPQEECWRRYLEYRAQEE